MSLYLILYPNLIHLSEGGKHIAIEATDLNDAIDGFVESALDVPDVRDFFRHILDGCAPCINLDVYQRSIRNQIPWRSFDPDTRIHLTELPNDIIITHRPLFVELARLYLTHKELTIQPLNIIQRMGINTKKCKR